MSDKLDLIKELRNKTLERIIEKHGGSAGGELREMKLSIWDVREILYEESKKIAKRLFEEDFQR